MKPTVIVQIDEDGELIYYCAEGVDLYIVDERAPEDRVYQWTTFHTAEEMKEVLGDSEIGSRHDDRHPALEAVILEAATGKPRLACVKD